MLNNIRIQNFKLHKDTSLEIKPITIFIGPNNSGKSSIFHALQLLKQRKKSAGNLLVSQKEFQSVRGTQFTYPDFLIDVGSFYDIVRKGGNNISIKIEGEYIPINLAMKKRNIDRIKVIYEMFFKDNSLQYHKGKISGGEYNLEWEWDVYRGSKKYPSSIQIEGITNNFSLNNTIHMPIVSGGRSTPPNTPREIQGEVDDLIKGLIQSPSNLIDSIHFIYGLRGSEEYLYPLVDFPSGDIELMLLDDRTVAIHSSFPYNRIAEDRLNEWLKEFFAVEVKFEIKERKNVKLEATRVKDKTLFKTLFVNEGLGLHQLLFMLIPIGMAQSLETICIEEPEAHLHPKAQSQLVNILLKIHKKEEKQFMMATHSEHILFGFLTAIAKKELSKDQLAIYYFTNKDGIADIKMVEIDEYGRVSGGLPEFFEHNVQNMIDYLNAFDKSDKNEV